MNINDYNLILEITAIIVFITAYIFITLEEITEIKKSKPALISAGIIWIITAIILTNNSKEEILILSIKKNLTEYCELFLFLFSTMIYINSMKDRFIFKKLKFMITKIELTSKKIYWIIGILSFIISPIADNLTTALIMSSILISIEKKNKQFINLCFINIVIASNAGGSFSPFGDITTLMLWQSNILKFSLFFKIIIPSILSFLIPSFIISLNIKEKKINKTKKNISIKYGGSATLFFFIITIFISILMQNYLNIPSAIGMMTGLSFLQILEFISKKEKDNFLMINQIKKIEWDTLLFFYGTILSIGAISTIGCLNEISNILYYKIGQYANIIHQQTPANILIGLTSSIIDNIPIMFAVITMNPIMSEGQWLLINLTAGIGGSLLSIGSAAGIALMGQNKKEYTFFSHLKHSYSILIGYIFSIYIHIIINKKLFLII